MIQWILILFVIDTIIHTSMSAMRDLLSHKTLKSLELTIRASVSCTFLCLSIFFYFVWSDHSHLLEYSIVVGYCCVSLCVAIFDYLDIDKRLNTPVLSIATVWVTVFVYAFVVYPGFRHFILQTRHGVNGSHEELINHEGVRPNTPLAADPTPK